MEVVLIFSAVIPLLASALFLHLGLVRALSSGKLGLLGAIAIFWLVIALLPLLIFALQVPALSYVYRTFPSLQVAAWDIGLAIYTSLCLVLNWLLAIPAAGLATWQLMCLKKNGHPDSAP